MVVSYPKNCDNAPKKRLLVELYQHLLEGELDHVDEVIAKNCQWIQVGKEVYTDKEKILSELNSIFSHVVTPLEVKELITHGNTAAVYGTITRKDSTRIEFCDVFRFNGFSKSAKISEIRSYWIKEKEA